MQKDGTLPKVEVTEAFGTLLTLAVALYFAASRAVLMSGDDQGMLAGWGESGQVVVSADPNGMTSDDPGDYEMVYRAWSSLAANKDESLALWLGNSQMHTINQYQAGDRLAPSILADKLGWPVVGLSMPNANLKEHLIALEMCLSIAHPSVLVLPLVYDDLREEGVREALTVAASLVNGQQVSVEEIDGVDEVDQDRQESLSGWSEAILNDQLARLAPAWGKRSQLVAQFHIAIYNFRNAALGINSQTKRRIIPHIARGNEEALWTMLDQCRSIGLPVVLYIAPLRMEPEPPYEMAEYQNWKLRIARAAKDRGLILHDLDRIVENDLWGEKEDTGEVDYMHFRGGGHIVLADEVYRLVKRIEPMDGASKEER